ncbi:ABC transporter permease [Flavihumibacter petaseus]|nr:ABC transporter permease [Flavihumibacter petaseus]
MFKNHFKIAWRSLWRDKQFTFLNVFGLSAGLASVLLIFLWVTDEMGFDRFFVNDDRLYSLLEGTVGHGDVVYSEESTGRLSEAVKMSAPEVEYAAAIAPAKWFAQNTLTAGDRNIKANGQYAERDYFNIFSFTLLQGNSNSVLASKNAIVLSDELAMKLFATTDDIIGKPVRFDHDTTFYVSGVFRKVPAQSSQQFDFVLSFDYFKSVKDWVTSWNARGPQNFVLLKKGADLTAFNKKIENIIGKNSGSDDRKVRAEKFSDGYLYRYDNDTSQTGGRIAYVKLFALLAGFVLLIACINFMNLSTAKASRRLKEVGIKKIVGVRRGQLVLQFLSESFLLTVLSMLLAVMLAVFLLPQFNQATGKQIQLQFTPALATGIVIIGVITGFFAGSYPALYLSGFKPITILKGKLNTPLAELLSRKGLVIFQFALSTILIVAVTVVYQQIMHIRNINLGYNKENIVRFSAEGSILKNEAAFLAAIQETPGVVNAATTFHSIVGRKYSDGLNWPGKDPEQDVYFEVFNVSQNFIKTMEMQVQTGRGFSPDFGMDSLNIVINEAAVKAMGLKDPIGAVVQFHGSNRQIIGVVKDFHFESMHESIKPAFLTLWKGEGSVIARISGNNQQETIAAIEQLYKKYNPDFPFTYSFLDEAYQKQYASETRTAVLSRYFAGLAIVISCLGLFGLTAFMAQKRRKEIGIRKVIGASSAELAAMLSKDFLKLVGIAMLIAFPVSWWIMQQWLLGYAYRISITPMIFLVAGVAVALITLAVTGFQTIKSALANPVESLRTE